MSAYLLPEPAPDRFSAFSKLDDGQGCVLILKTGEEIIGHWCTSMNRFKAFATHHGWINRDDIDEWWTLTAQCRLPRR